MPAVLQTERLVLRGFTEHDLEHLVDLDGDPEVRRFLDGRSVPRELVERETLPRMLRPGYWAAIEKASGRFVGWFALRPPDESQPEIMELGYRLVRAAWGQGYATEGSRALIRKAFTELGAQRVVANTMTVNTGSRRVMEKSGLRYVRTYFAEWPEYLEGAEHGDVEYELHRADWQG